MGFGRAEGVERFMIVVERVCSPYRYPPGTLRLRRFVAKEDSQTRPPPEPVIQNQDLRKEKVLIQGTGVPTTNYVAYG